MAETKNYDGIEYLVIKITPQKTGYGKIGSRGVMIVRKKDNKTMGKFDNWTEFKNERKIIKQLKNK